MTPTLPVEEALARLREGNRRFVEGRSGPARWIERRAEVAQSQAPLAVVLGCSDSRVPPEIVFDQGLGDLFVVRVAGNVAGPTQIASVEFAVERLGARLALVLGHTGCGAVAAALDAAGESPPGLAPILDPIRRVIDSFPGAGDGPPTDAVRARAVRENIRASVRSLRSGSETIERLVREDGLVVAGAEYSLETGEVEFLS